MRLKSPPKWVWGIGGGFVVLCGFIIGGILKYRAEYHQFVNKTVSEPVIAQVEPAGEFKNVTYTLNEGWNFISFPFAPVTVTTAAELIRDIAVQGGLATVVSQWDQDHWQEYAQRGLNPYGEDFKLTALKGIFILSHKQIEWTAGGLTGTGNVPIEHQLNPGWNAVGFSGDSVARQMLDHLSSDGIERVNEIDTWNSGNWNVFVKRWYTPTHTEEYGNNFPITTTGGYMIKANETVKVPARL